MKFLLDTYTFLWTVAGSGKIPNETRSKIKSRENEISVSAVSLWEIAIKTRIKKLDLGPIKLEDLIPYAEKMGFELISLTPEEAISYVKLEEKSHFDPFDRMLIWQAIQRNMTMVSKDEDFQKFKKHGLKLLWQ